MRILICGGGTGGHIYPGLALARYIRKKRQDAEILFVGTARGSEKKIVPEAGFNLKEITVRAFKKYPPAELWGATVDLCRSIKQSLEIVRDFEPDVVVGTGGYVAGPAVLASRMRRRPIVIHEQNVIPGRTYRILARWADRICISFEASRVHFKDKRVVLTGNPRAGEVVDLTREEGFERFEGLDPRKRTILVVGGSQGALRMNEVMVDLVTRGGLPSGSQLLYITGNSYYGWVKEKIGGESLPGILLMPYLHDMPAALAIADLIISRAGATALAEITARGVPAFLVPSPNVAHNHQYFNARLLEGEGAARIMMEKDFTAVRLAGMMEEMFGAPEKLKEMARKSRGMGTPDAASRMYRCLLEAMEQ